MVGPKEEDFTTLLLNIDPNAQPMARHFHQRLAIVEARSESWEKVWSAFRWVFLPSSLLLIAGFVLEIIKVVKS